MALGYYLLENEVIGIFLINIGKKQAINYIRILIYCVYVLFALSYSYLSERETADRNFALGYYMKENKVCASL